MRQIDDTFLFASKKGYTEIVKLLLEAGADVNTKDSYRDTPLMYASKYGRTETVRLLLEAGADVNAKTEKGETSLIYASNNGILVSLIHPEYTSKMCSHCGCIDDLNRKTQEEFCCIDCGYAENADIHSAKNIKFRLTSTVLRGNLLEKTGDSGYSFFQPKSLFRWQIRKELEQCRSSTLLKQCAENHKSLTSSNDL